MKKKIIQENKRNSDYWNLTLDKKQHEKKINNPGKSQNSDNQNFPLARSRKKKNIIIEKSQHPHIQNNKQYSA